MRSRILALFLPVAIFAGTPSKVPALSNTVYVPVQGVVSGDAKGGFADLTAMENAAARIYDFETEDHKTDVKLQRHWILTLMKVVYENGRATKLKGVEVDAIHLDRSIELINQTMGVMK